MRISDTAHEQVIGLRAPMRATVYMGGKLLGYAKDLSITLNHAPTFHLPPGGLTIREDE